jgi:hypothetical protein
MARLCDALRLHAGQQHEVSCCTSRNVTLPIVGEAVGDTAAKWPDIMAPSTPDGNIEQCVDGSALAGTISK